MTSLKKTVDLSMSEWNVDYLCSVEYRKDGEEVLASYSSDYIYIFDPKARQPLKQTYRDWF
jgi:hypothetical protein